MDKLNSLAARAMGWELNSELDAPACYYYFYIESKKAVRINIGSPKETAVRVNEWNPSTCADDALILLEKMLPENWTLKHQDNGYFCWDEPMSEDSKYLSHAETATLAMTICALGAANIPESEITAAME